MKNTFKWLNVSTFTGAFNDNAFKMTAVMVLVKSLGYEQLPSVVATCSMLFVFPFLLFSNLAGTLADRFSKRDIIIASKWLEVVLILLTVPVVLSGAPIPVYGLLFLICTQSALFGPSKRGIVPEIVADHELSRANGYLTSATYIAIILGTALPSLLIGYLGRHPLYAVGACGTAATVGLWGSYRISHVPTSGECKTSSPWIIPDVTRALHNLRPDRWAWLAVWGLVLFGAVSALLQQTLILYGHEVLGMPVDKSPMLFPLAAVGIGIGALLTGKLSRHTIEIGFIPVGAIGIMLTTLGLATADGTYAVCLLILLLGMASGMYLVPLNAFLQHRIPANRRGEVFGASGFLSFSAMVAASGLFYLLTRALQCSARTCVLATGLLAAVPAVMACLRLPGFLVRFWLVRLTRGLYRIRFSGLDNIPDRGGALIICNHTAYSDALLLQAATSRPIRFIMSRDVFKNWKWAKPVFTLTDCIPVHTSDGPRALARSLQEARKALEEGSIVAIFPEGKLTRNGNLMPFSKGFEKIAKNSGCPVIPAYIGDIWGSIFSFYTGKPGLHRPLRFPYPVCIRFGKALPADITAHEARQAISELAAEHAIERSREPGNTLAHHFLRQARRHWFRHIASDTLGRKASYGKLLTGSVALAERIRSLTGDTRNIGIYLPTSLGAALANIASVLSGRTAVNLNWTAPVDARRSAVRQAGVHQVITSRQFLRKLQQPDLEVQWVYIEDELRNMSVRQRLRALAAALTASPAHLAGGREPLPDDTVAIIFSSGTTGEPKGVMLSHANILSNVEATQSVEHFTERDAMCAVLPMFHAFGYLGLLWWPLLKGIRVAYHPNPLETQRVVQLIREAGLTGLLATPTFLQNYMRKASPADFRSLRHVIVGGERLRPELAESFMNAFGIRPMEGYGCTELSPVTLLSFNNSYRPGSAGQPLPGIAARIVDPQTRKPLPCGRDGLMLIRGPNVMQGYLGQPNLTRQVLCDGWYNTGDIAHIDAEGYVYISGRLSRFSKIAGEMVPHGAVEDALQKAADSDEPCVAVVGMADAVRGEQLAVCYTDQAGNPEDLVSRLRAFGLPNLWIPRTANFFRIPELPLLGTGKLDILSLRNRIGIA